MNQINCKKKFKKGFTLIELIVVLGIIVIVSALTIPAFDYILGSRNFTNAADTFVTDVRLVRNKALAASTDNTTLPTDVHDRVSQWIIEITCGSSDYSIAFDLENSATPDPEGTIKSLTLQNGLYFPADTSDCGISGSTLQIRFNRLSGFPDTAVNIPLTDDNNSAVVSISARGNIELQ